MFCRAVAWRVTFEGRRVVKSGYTSDRSGRKRPKKWTKKGRRIKIVADGGYNHVVVGQKGVSFGALLSGGPVWSFDVAKG